MAAFFRLLFMILAAILPAVIEFPASPAGRGWVLLDFDAAICASCFQPALDCLAALPESLQEENLLGIVVFAGPSDPQAAAARRRVVEKQWDALARSGRIRMPVVFDGSSLWKGILGNRIALALCFDPGTRSLREFPLPLHGAEFDAFLALLLH